jgi:hypothetical protein
MVTGTAVQVQPLPIDERLGTRHAAACLKPEGLRQQWAGGRFDAAAQKEHIGTLSALVDLARG